MYTEWEVVLSCLAFPLFYSEDSQQRVMGSKLLLYNDRNREFNRYPIQVVRTIIIQTLPLAGHGNNQ